MTTSAIRQKLYEYIREADDIKLKALYTIVEEDVDQTPDWWKDKKFVAELDRISHEMKSGTDKGASWELLKSEMLQKTQPSDRDEH